MAKETIAVVRLMPGQGGYYDPYSRIHLTTGNPQAEIKAGTNCSQLLRSVRSGRLKLVTGSLAPKKPETLTETEVKTAIREAVKAEKEEPSFIREEEPKSEMPADEVSVTADGEKTEEKAEQTGRKRKKGR